MEKLLIEFIDSLDSSLKKFQKQMGESSGFSKLTINQIHYIDAVNDLGKPAITQIADRLKISKASVTAGINKLVNLGFVRKNQSNEDKRVFHVSLTEEGEHLINLKYQVIKEYEEFISSALSAEEARQFEDILSKLVKHFKNC
jgi:DNA-binding MarR family transcriptional regulator